MGVSVAKTIEAVALAGFFFPAVPFIETWRQKNPKPNKPKIQTYMIKIYIEIREGRVVPVGADVPGMGMSLQGKTLGDTILVNAKSSVFFRRIFLIMEGG